MMKWEKVGRKVCANGESTTYYEADGKDGRYVIESRKRAIPHANGDGFWMHTTYWLINPDGTEKEYYSLRDAKAAAKMEV